MINSAISPNQSACEELCAMLPLNPLDNLHPAS
jgi:hypothetical protein